MKRIVAVLLIALGATFTLTGCDERKCIDGHIITSIMPVFNGKVTVLIPHTMYICDVYEGG